jgi:hypothetical protein
MPPDLEKKLYLQGIELFNDHETWEDIWHTAYGIKHDFYQGMIQAAVALEHYRRSNPRGVVSLHRTYPTKFRNVPPRFMGLDVPRFLAAMDDVLRPVTAADPIPERGEIQLDLSRTPRITLDYDPFETGEAQRYDRPEKF